MFKPTALVILFLLFFVGHSQEVSLPADMRQHTLTQYNASLFNPTFSLDRNNPQSVAFWTRWQWQNIDADPTTLFLNYTTGLNDHSAAGLGFFQHNTGIYFNTGAALNYSYQIEFNRLIKLSIGANIFGFSQEIADTRFPITPLPGIQQSAPTNDFILQVAPGFNLQVENFSLSLASENLFDYNFNDKGSNTATSDKIFMGMASYDFPVMASDSTAFIRPSIYLRTIPEEENQIGLNALFSTKRYWIQSGFNNFYGISVGAGGTVFNRFSLGALVEFGTSGSINTKDPSFEVLFSYFLGKPDERRPLVASGIIDEGQQQVLLADEIEEQKLREELANAEQLANQKSEEDKLIDVDEKKEKVIPEVDAQKENIADKKEEKRLADEQRALENQQRKDSIAELKRVEEEIALREKRAAEQAKIVADAAKKKEAIEAAAKAQEAERIEKLKKDQNAAAIAEMERANQQRKLDSIQDAKKAEDLAAALKEEHRLDSIAKSIVTKEAVVVSTQIEDPAEADFKYQAIASKEGIDPGFYLVVNIFGTKKYFDLFIKDLSNKGLQPKSFYRKLNKYNYVYLKRFDNINDARRARDNRFDGRYKDKISIFSVENK
jgi:type IX secretion system PorP/SprF family membrane protein